MFMTGGYLMSAVSDTSRNIVPKTGDLRKTLNRENALNQSPLNLPPRLTTRLHSFNRTHQWSPWH